MPLRSYRPLIMGPRGAVASNHPLSSQAGLDVLRANGNAVDATVAMGFAIGVVEPHMSGIGGDSFYQLHLAGDSRGVVVNGTGAAPATSDRERFRRSGIPNYGPVSASIPGTVGSLWEMHKRYGRLSWSELLKPAIEFARSGFAATHAYRHFARQERERLTADKESHRIFLHASADGSPPPLGALVVQEDLARTLEEIAADGAETFYRGRLARRLAQAMQDRGGLLTKADLASYEPEFQAPIAIRYRDFEVRQTPPNSTGFVLLQELKIAERFDLAGFGADSAGLVHVMVEAKKRAFLDRERFGQDPRFGAVPLDELLSDGYAHRCAASIDLRQASRIEPVEQRESDTTYFCVVDSDGNAVSAIQSLNLAFGSGVLAGDTGVLMNNRMAYWHLQPGHANLLKPGKRVRHTMNAPMVFKDGKLWCVFGTPGADNQVQVNFQVAVAMMDFGYDPQQAVEAPRWSSNQPGQDSNFPHPGELAVSLEARFQTSVLSGLETRGHKVIRIGDLDGPCNVEAIRLLDNGVRMAGSDPRRDGWALAY